MNLIERAQIYAHEAHDAINQRRKYNNQPYWVHTDEVASIVRDTPGTTESMVAAAHLHDVLEDVFPILNGYNFERIQQLFGNEVAGHVLDLTDVYTKKDFPKLNRKERHALEYKRLALISPKSKTIKLADSISNTASIVADDPDFARVYLREKLALLPLLIEGSPVLLQRASQQVVEGFNKLGEPMTIYSSGPR